MKKVIPSSRKQVGRALKGACLLTAALLAVAVMTAGCKSDSQETVAAPQPTPQAPPPANQPPPSGGGGGTTPTPGPIVSPLLFGLNLPWFNNGDRLMRYGDQLRDRSFRQAGSWTFSGGPGATASFVGCPGGTGCPGAPAPAGGVSYPGFESITNGSTGKACVRQPLTDPRPNVTYEFNLGLFGVGGSVGAEVGLYDSGLTPLDFMTPAAPAGSWIAGGISGTLNPAGIVPAYFYVCVTSPSATMLVDEVRLAEQTAPSPGGPPQMIAAAKTQLTGLGVRAVRWPGGATVDSFDWKRTIGPRMARGEMDNVGSWETPALGLHEFLDVAEELGFEPVLQVNVLGPNPAQDAADLVEYVLGDSGTAQGVIRSANGRNLPWNVFYFELGNEPNPAYTDGTTYAAAAGGVATAMYNKAAALGVPISIGGIVETNRQLADDLSTQPLLANWNVQLADPTTGLVGAVDFVTGHFYPYDDYHATEIDRFEHVMTAGEVLRQTEANAIAPLVPVPLWITEHHVRLVDKSSAPPILQTQHLLDRQSALGEADMLMTMMEGGFDAAFAFDAADVNFGLLKQDGLDSWLSRPAGIVFTLLSQLVGGEVIYPVYTATPGGQFTVVTGIGNVPSGLTYDLVGVLGVKDGVTGKSHVVLLNRDYLGTHDVSLSLPDFAGATATIYRMEGALADNNDGFAVQVSLTTTTGVALSDPYTITLQPHSLVRLDVE